MSEWDPTKFIYVGVINVEAKGVTPEAAEDLAKEIADLVLEAVDEDETRFSVRLTDAYVMDDPFEGGGS